MKVMNLGARLVLIAGLSLAVASIGCSSDGGGDGGTGGGGDGGSGGGGGMGDGGSGGMGEGGGGGMGEGGMGGGGTGGTPPPEFTITATPAGTAFATDVEVTLEATGPGSDVATIYYTTDLTPVLDEDGNVQGIEYDGPIDIDETTVLKFLGGAETGGGGGGGGGGDGGAVYSSEQWEGYTRTNGDSKFEEWAESGHGDIAAEAWRHWDADGAVPNRCAKCHAAESVPGVGNSLGFLEFATSGEVNEEAPLPLGLECAACHERFPTIYSDLETYFALEPVEFPSGEELTLYANSNICMSCHQGRESGEDVKDTIADSEGPYTFINIHYYPAAATMFGSEAIGGFEYEDLDYRPRNTFPSHPGDVTNCVGCHMQNAEDGEGHTWQVGVDNCTGCHGGDSFETLGGSPQSNYDKISALLPELYAEIQTYADEVIGMPIVYDSSAYPYWFNDNGNGANYGNRYTDFDAALLAAAYNYQAALKDPAGYIHNGIYLQQIVHDSIVDLGGTSSVDVIGRGDLALNGSDVGLALKTEQWAISGHGALDEEAFRHWDEDGAIPGSCTKCHSTAGFAEFADGDPTTEQLPLNGVDCWSCHVSRNLFANTATRYSTSTSGDPLEPVEFPSGAELTLGNDGNMCMACHQGRSSGSDVDDAESNGQNAYDSFDFINIHYYAAAAVLFGTEAAGGYEYDNGEDYRGRNTFVGLHDTMGLNLTDCVGCHMNSSGDAAKRAKHTFLPEEVGDCSLCHGGGPRFRDLNTAPRTNWNAIESLKAQLLVAIQAYATTGNPATGLPQDSPVQYEGSSYPYWFIDGVAPIYPNRYRDFDRTMLRAAYNYVVADKDPGGYIHNGTYVQQLLWDSILDLGECPNLNPPPQGRDPIICE